MNWEHQAPDDMEKYDCQLSGTAHNNNINAKPTDKGKRTSPQPSSFLMFSIRSENDIPEFLHVKTVHCLLCSLAPSLTEREREIHDVY